MAALNLKSLIRDIPDFPKKGILFKDITTLLKNPEGLHQAADELGRLIEPHHPDQIVGIESRGFIFGSILAYKFKAGFIPVRKKGKLPGKTLMESYELEYGTSELEIHHDAILQGTHIAVIDDLLATGGTAQATIRLIEKLGGKVMAVGFLVELAFLKGREKLNGYNVFSLIQY